jgi:hypothetical protein
MRAIYPEHVWLEWQFTSVPRSFWNDVNNQKRFLEWASGELGVKSLSDWYKVKSAQIIKLGGSFQFFFKNKKKEKKEEKKRERTFTE